jgi:hypothetical protein
LENLKIKSPHFEEKSFEIAHIFGEFGLNLSLELSPFEILYLANRF